jgi:amino acid permease
MFAQVGVGSLSLPLAFSQAGLFLSSGIIILLAFMAYITLSWVIECLSLANFVLRWRNNDLSTPMREHATPLLLQVEANADEQKSMFDITQKVELGEMAHMFMSLRGTSIFYALLCIYLFGDLLIYAVFVPLTLSKACGDFSIWTFHFNEDSSYYFFLLCFAVLVLPFCFMNFSNTKLLQMFCLAMRNVALMAMIVIAMFRAVGDQRTPSAQIKLMDFNQIPAVFGVGIYAFMCHHSLPSIVSPISHKRGLHALFLADYILICIIYLLLCVSAVFAFSPDLPAKCLDADGPPCRIQGYVHLIDVCWEC